MNRLPTGIPARRAIHNPYHLDFGKSFAPRQLRQLRVIIGIGHQYCVAAVDRALCGIVQRFPFHHLE
jgi:hypothetical protein